MTSWYCWHLPKEKNMFIKSTRETLVLASAGKVSDSFETIHPKLILAIAYATAITFLL